MHRPFIAIAALLIAPAALAAPCPTGVDAYVESAPTCRAAPPGGFAATRAAGAGE